MTETRAVSLWGRDIDFTVIYDCYTGEEVLAKQRDAVNKLLENWSDAERSKTAVAEFCLERDPDKFPNGSIDNIFKYVMPQQLYIERTTEKRVVYILCAYRYDDEAGIAIKFVNEKLAGVSTQSNI